MTRPSSRRTDVATTLVVLLAALLVGSPAPAGESADQTTGATPTELADSDNPAERLRGQIRLRELGVEEAIDRLDELRSRVGPEQPGHVHLAAARLNTYEGAPYHGLIALDAALEANPDLVDDALRLELAEHTLREALADAEFDDRIDRAYRHIVAVDPDYAHLDEATLDRVRLRRLNALLDSPRLDDQTLASADEICRQILPDSDYLPRFARRCSKTAHLLGDGSRSEQMLLDWIDAYDDPRDRLDAVLYTLDELEFEPLVGRMLRNLAPDVRQWRLDASLHLADYAYELMETEQLEGDDNDRRVDRLLITSRATAAAYLDDRLQEARQWGRHYADVGPIDDQDERATWRTRFKPTPTWLSDDHLALLYADADLIEAALADNPDPDLQPLADVLSDASATGADTPSDDLAQLFPPRRLFIETCPDSDHPLQDYEERLARVYATVHDDRYDELAADQCPFTRSDLRAARTEILGEMVSLIEQKLSQGESHQAASIVESVVENRNRSGDPRFYCITRDCSDELQRLLTERYGSTFPGAAPDIPLLDPDWRAGGPLAPPLAAASSPEDDRLATFHMDATIKDRRARALVENDPAPYQNLAPASLVIWDEKTGTELRRLSLPVDPDAIGRYTFPNANSQLTWHGDHVAVVTRRSTAIVDLETEATKTVRAESVPSFDHTGDVLKARTLHEGQLTTARRAYRRGPVQRVRHFLEDLENPETETIWAPHPIREWDAVLGDGTLVRTTDTHLEWTRSDGSIRQVEFADPRVLDVMNSLPNLGTTLRASLADDLLYVVSDNVYAIDLETGDIETTFGACPYDRGTQTLTDATDLEADGTLSASRVDDLPSALRDCETSLERPPLDADHAVKFLETPEASLPWTPIFYDTSGSSPQILNLATGERWTTDCDALPAPLWGRPSQPDQTGDSGIGRGTGGMGLRGTRRDHDDAEPTRDWCKETDVCQFELATELQGSVVETPTLFGAIGTDRSTVRDEGLVLQTESDAEQKTAPRWGARGITTDLVFTDGATRLVSTTHSPTDGVAVRDTVDGGLQWLFQGRFPYATMLLDDGPDAVTIGNHPDRDAPPAARWTPGQASLDTCGEISGLDVSDLQRRYFQTGDDRGQWMLVYTDETSTVVPPDVDDPGDISRAAVCPGTTRVALPAGDGDIEIRDPATSADRVARIESDDDHLATAVEFAPDCRLAVTHIPRDETSKSRARLEIHEPQPGGRWRQRSTHPLDLPTRPTALGWHPAGWLLVGTEDGVISLLDPATGQTALRLLGLDERPTAITVDTGGRHAAAGTKTGRVAHWSLETDLPTPDDADLDELHQRFENHPDARSPTR